MWVLETVLQSSARAASWAISPPSSQTSVSFTVAAVLKTPGPALTWCGVGPGCQDSKTLSKWAKVENTSVLALEQRKQGLHVPNLSDADHHLKGLLNDETPDSLRRDQGICLFNNPRCVIRVLKKGCKSGSGGGSGHEERVLMPSKIKLEEIKFSTLFIFAFIYFQLKTHQNNQIWVWFIKLTTLT